MTTSNKTRQNAAAAKIAAAEAAQSLAQSAVQKAKEKAKVGIFTREGAPVNAILFINTSTHERAPMFGGSIRDIKVSAFLRTPTDAKKKPFLSFVDGEGNQVATANAVVRKNGTPTMKAIFGGHEVWFTFSKNVSHGMLTKMGVDVSRLKPLETSAA